MGNGKTTSKPRGLPCPRCGGGLELSRKGGVEIDICPGCHGVWSKRWEVEAFLRAKDWPPCLACQWSREVYTTSVPGATCF